jgi:HEPN domain-containing protein
MSAKKNVKHTLLDRAKGDLSVLQILLPKVSEETEIDICAYHCQQCIEKTIKYAADLTGQEYVSRHELVLLVEDLELPDIIPLIKPYITLLDTWISAAYSATTRSNLRLVTDIFEVCKQVVGIAETMTPKKVESSALAKDGENSGSVGE